VPIRDMATAGLSRAAKMTAEERLRQAAAAHAAVRGTSQSEELLVRRALAKQRKGRYDSPGEMLLGEALSDRGLIVVPQKAIGKYNVDLAVAPVAVEVLGGGWHSTKRSHATRTPEILNAGWHLVFVWNHEGSSALSVNAATDYVVAFLQEVRRNPPTVGQYRVISGSGQLLAAGSAEDDEFPLVPPPRGRLSKGA
jgi:very-short-patch-repair endonuclease